MTQARYRTRLPQMNGHKMLTDGGLETTLIFRNGLDLPCFAAFDLLRSRDGVAILRDYYTAYAQIAVGAGKGFVLDSPTWRASRDWGRKLGYGVAALEQVNRDAIDLLVELRDRFDSPRTPFVISGNVGPRGDGYDPAARQSVDRSRDYHGVQIGIFADTAADMITVLTMTHAEEATGIALAARDAGLPAAISFTVETDGRLPTGQPLNEAIAQVDAETGNAPAYYMINCAHPTHFGPALGGGGGWTERVRGVRANASCLSHAELDEATELDDGDPEELAGQYRALQRQLPELAVFGGCCGTDHRHLGAIARRIAA